MIKKLTKKQLEKIKHLKNLWSIRDIIFILLSWLYTYFIKVSEENPFKTFMQANLNEYVLKIISIIILFVLSLWIIWLIIYLLDKIVSKIFEKTKNDVDDLFLNESVHFLNRSKYLLSVYIGFHFVNFWDSLQTYINKALLSIVIIFLIILICNIFSIFYDEVLLKTKKMKFLSKSISSVLRKTVIILIWTIWVLTILSKLGFNITALIAWAWIWGLAFAFAAQKSIANIFWAITILLNKPFVIWDFVNINWVEWTVKDLWLSYITVTQKFWHQVMIPNETIISTNVENYTVRDSRRLDFAIWLVYGTSLEKMKEWVKIIENILESYKEKEEISKYRVNFDTFWDFSLNINVTYFSLVKDDYALFLKQKEEINLKIKDEFEKAWLDMAFPTQELILKQENN